jgi:8-oxo-dGTP pyrophosphatase MutT (NUDIX family)
VAGVAPPRCTLYSISILQKHTNDVMYSLNRNTTIQQRALMDKHTQKRRVVGILFLSLEEDGTPIAWLQKRGQVHFGKHTGRQTWPGICQVSVEGKVNGDESLIEALLREIKEEFGGEFLRHVSDTVRDGYTQMVYTDTHTHTYAALIPKKFFEYVRLEPISGGLVPVRNRDINRLVAARTDWKDKFHGLSETVVYPRVILALKAAFPIFATKSPKHRFV